MSEAEKRTRDMGTYYLMEVDGLSAEDITLHPVAQVADVAAGRKHLKDNPALIGRFAVVRVGKIITQESVTVPQVKQTEQASGLLTPSVG